MKIIIATVMLCCLIATASVKAADGNDLMRHCQKAVTFLDTDNYDADNDIDIGWCVGYVHSFTKLNVYYKAFDIPVPICFPESGIKNRQAVRVLVKYLQDHPENLHKYDMILTILAFAEAYPCE